MKSKYPTKWNLSKIFNSLDDPRIKEQIDSSRKVHEAFAKEYLDNETIWTDIDELYEALVSYIALSEGENACTDVAYYLYMSKVLNQSDDRLIAENTKFQDFGVEMGNLVKFFSVKLSKIDPQMQREVLNDKRFEPYYTMLKETFESGKYVLSVEAEQILSLKDEVASQKWREMLNKFISGESEVSLGEDGEEKLRSFEELMAGCYSLKDEVRLQSASAVNKILSRHIDVAVEEINAVVKDHIIDAKLRGYPRIDFGSHNSNQIDTGVVDAMRRAVISRFDISNRYYELKKKKLGIKTQNYYDRVLPVGEVDMGFGYDEVVDISREVFEEFHPEAARAINDIIKLELIDVYPAEGKSNGAFCMQSVDVDKVFVMLNHTDKLRDLQTFAHELGHGVNHYLYAESQPHYYASGSVATAEVASTFFEGMVTAKVEEKVSDEEKEILFFGHLDGVIATIFRQVAAYEFEFELHQLIEEKGYLGKKEINELFVKHMKAYLGGSVEMPEESAMWWVYWSHFRADFYVFSYASGELIANSLLAKYSEDNNFADKIIEFLKIGTSLNVKDSFDSLGVDVTDENFWLEGLDLIDQKLKALEAKYK